MIKREIIGNPDCPLMYRWTLLERKQGRFGFKVMVHHFLPGLTDPDVHDHPRPFATLVLWGSYRDRVRCATCKDDGPAAKLWCPCGGTRMVWGDTMKAGTFRRRSANYAHSTVAGPKGAWTLCIMGPLRRPWGFWRDGQWWGFKTYERVFGFDRRCD
jgi:hypothetical protein